MATLVDCPSCSRKLRVPDDLLGHNVRCPDCGNTFTAHGGPVPSLAPAAAPAADAPALEPAAPPADAAASPGAPHAVTGSGRERAPAGTAEETYPCPACRKRIPVSAARCPSCGVDLGEEDSRPWERPRRYLGRMDTEPHRGVVIRVLGILGLVIGVIGLPMAIIAWVLGHSDLKKIRAGAMDPEGEGLTQAGRICGIIGTIWQSLMLVGCVAWMIIWITFATTIVRSMPPPPATKAAPVPPPAPVPGQNMPIPEAPGKQPPAPGASKQTTRRVSPPKQTSRGTEASSTR